MVTEAGGDGSESRKPPRRVAEGDGGGGLVSLPPSTMDCTR